MKKRVLSGAAACGLLLVGAATLPQDRPSFRDVLRGKVGQACRVGSAYGTWTLVFSTGAGAQAEGANALTVARQVPSTDDLMQVVKAHGIDEYNEAAVQNVRNAALGQFVKDLAEQAFDGNLALVNPKDLMTVSAVGQDFVQLREADGTERFVPLARVDVVVRPDK